jgi:hypothetical protein
VRVEELKREAAEKERAEKERADREMAEKKEETQTLLTKIAVPKDEDDEKK